MSLLTVQLAHQLKPCPEQHRWLIEGLWADQAVGIIGGQPKCCKSFLALDMAVSVASGTWCLRRFPVARPGRVLLFAAEDALHIVRQRFDGICQAAGLDIESLDIHVITTPTLRLDLPQDRQALAETVAHLHPRLLVLDPFVRLHTVDENASKDIAPLLAFLRQLQRQHHVAITVVHHARKNPTKAGSGQALRGSSEFHAWGDSNLYLRRQHEHLVLSIEHRAAPSHNGILLALKTQDNAVALESVEDKSQLQPGPTPSLEQRVQQILAETSYPLSFRTLRQSCRIRAATLSDTLTQLTKQGRVLKTNAGYMLADHQVPFPFPTHPKRSPETETGNSAEPQQ